MNNNVTAIQPIEYREQRVLLTKQLAEFYEIEPQVIQQNFLNNKERYFEGEDYFLLEGKELRALKNDFENFEVVHNKINKLYLWTEYGALLHAKSLNSDAAWMVFKRLRDTYFRARAATAVGAGAPVTPDVANFLARKVTELEARIGGFAEFNLSPETLQSLWRRISSMEELVNPFAVNRMWESFQHLFEGQTDIFRHLDALDRKVKYLQKRSDEEPAAAAPSAPKVRLASSLTREDGKGVLLAFKELKATHERVFSEAFEMIGALHDRLESLEAWRSAIMAPEERAAQAPEPELRRRGGRTAAVPQAVAASPANHATAWEFALQLGLGLTRSETAALGRKAALHCERLKIPYYFVTSSRPKRNSYPLEVLFAVCEEGER